MIISVGLFGIGGRRRRGRSLFAEEVVQAVAFDGQLEVLEGAAAGFVDEELGRERHPLLAGQKPENENDGTR